MTNTVELIGRAVALHQTGRLDEADAIYTQVLQLEPNQVDALHLSGLIAHQRGRVIDAIDRVGRAVKLRPTEAGFWFNFGNVLTASGGRDAEAVDAFRTAAHLKPDFVDALNNLANALDRLKRFSEVPEVRRKIVALRPSDADARYRLARSLHDLGQLGPAVVEYRRAIELAPGLTVALENLAPALLGLGRSTEAMDVMKQLLPADDSAVQISAAVHSNLLLALQYSDTVSPEEVFEAHQRWARIHLPEQPVIQPARFRSDSERSRIRVGYVSADFWNHPVGHFIRPLIEKHDRNRFEVICYDHSEISDWVTKSLKQSATLWRHCRGLSDLALAEWVRHDRVDILVDLSGHTAGNRLTAFALKPAPVQVTYLGYPGTTAVPEIDYRMTDAITDPIGLTDSFNTEKLIRLPRCFVCHTPPADAPAVGPAPFDRNGHITFGSFNTASKITPTTVRLWASAMNSVLGSKLLLKALGWADGENQRRLLKEFAVFEIDPGRITFVPPDKNWRDHMNRYGQVDLALDPFPYHGTTTTCDALWMGVPTITLAGKSHVSRVGASLMIGAGLPEFVATDEAAFVRIATDAVKLGSARSTLRDRLRNSPLCDAATFTANVETAFEKMVR